MFNKNFPSNNNIIDFLNSLNIPEDKNILFIYCAPSGSGKNHLLENGLLKQLNKSFENLKVIDSDFFKIISENGKKYKEHLPTIKQQLKQKSITNIINENQKYILWNTRSNNDKLTIDICNLARSKNYHIICLSPQRSNKLVIEGLNKRENKENLNLPRRMSEHSIFFQKLSSYIQMQIFDVTTIINNGLTENNNGNIIAFANKKTNELKFSNPCAQESFFAKQESYTSKITTEPLELVR